MNKFNNFKRVPGGFLHDGLGYRRSRVTGEYPVYRLPRWNIYRNRVISWAPGTYEDVLGYMQFTFTSYQTCDEDLSGFEIAEAILGTDVTTELNRMITENDMPADVTWNEVFSAYQRRHDQERISAWSHTPESRHKANLLLQAAGMMPI